MDDKEVDPLGADLDTPLSKREEFQRNYKDPTRRKEAYLDYYAHNHPIPSWVEIAHTLRTCGLPQQTGIVQTTYVQGIV